MTFKLLAFILSPTKILLPPYSFHSKKLAPLFWNGFFKDNVSASRGRWGHSDEKEFLLSVGLYSGEETDKQMISLNSGSATITQAQRVFRASGRGT